MLKIVVEPREFFDESKFEFVYTKQTILCLEHSLISLSKWESKWHKPFLGNKEIAEEEMIDYIRCMTISQNVDPLVYMSLSENNVLDIKSYMDDAMTATTFRDNANPKTRQKNVTSELIYYWMTNLGIPFECEKWHLNRLLTLIRVCNIENGPKKKMRQSDIIKQNRAINEQRKRMLNSRG